MRREGLSRRRVVGAMFRVISGKESTAGMSGGGDGEDSRCGVSRCRVGRLLFKFREAGCRTVFLPIGCCLGVKVRPLELWCHFDVCALLFIFLVASVRWSERCEEREDDVVGYAPYAVEVSDFPRSTSPHLKFCGLSPTVHP